MSTQSTDFDIGQVVRTRIGKVAGKRRGWRIKIVEIQSNIGGATHLNGHTVNGRPVCGVSTDVVTKCPIKESF